MNRAIIIGHITKDVEIRHTQNGTAVGSFIVAANRRFSGQNGEKETDFIQTVVWGKVAENCSKFLGKGSHVAVSGRIQTRSYEDKNGQRRYVTEVVADEVEFLSKKQEEIGFSELPEECFMSDDLNLPF